MQKPLQNHHSTNAQIITKSFQKPLQIHYKIIANFITKSIQHHYEIITKTLQTSSQKHPKTPKPHFDEN